MSIKSFWRVTSNPIGDHTLYRVFRIRNIAEVDHSGNREYYGDYTEDRQKALDIAEKLNLGEMQP